MFVETDYSPVNNWFFYFYNSELERYMEPDPE